MRVRDRLAGLHQRRPPGFVAARIRGGGGGGSRGHLLSSFLPCANVLTCPHSSRVKYRIEGNNTSSL